MPRRSKTTLTPLELKIMKVLWDTGPANVQTVQQNLPGARLAYTTVQTMLNVLETKGKVKRTLKDRAYIYRPALSRRRAVGQTMKDIIDRLFGGSAEDLVLGLLETRHLTPARLAKLQREIAEVDDGKR